jgi:hypothetical protein
MTHTSEASENISSKNQALSFNFPILFTGQLEYFFC